MHDKDRFVGSIHDDEVTRIANLEVANLAQEIVVVKLEDADHGACKTACDGAQRRGQHHHGLTRWRTHGRRQLKGRASGQRPEKVLPGYAVGFKGMACEARHVVPDLAGFVHHDAGRPRPCAVTTA